MFACPRICVEVDLEKGFLEAILLTLDKLKHVQKLDYKQLSFKCKTCHEYGHFAKDCKKNQPQTQTVYDKEQRQTIKKKIGAKQ